jgi:CBS domain-containing protein
MHSPGDAHPPAPSLTLQGLPGGSDPYISLISTPVREVLSRAPVTMAANATIADAARKMRDERVSSLLLVEQDCLVGIVTDRDLRNRVLAAGLDPRAALWQIATRAPVSIDASQPAFEALMLMTRHHIHHVPVLDGARVAGMITATDVMKRHTTTAVSIASDIHAQTTVQGLATESTRVRALQQTLAAGQASAYATGRIITTITDAITSRLLALAQGQLGPPPVPYAWVAAGSQGRCEQTARSDQDNCLVIHDAYDEAAHGEYFKALAHLVNHGLNDCGYVYCPGDMMARTDAWRQPRRRWAEYFARWIGQPEPQALMLTSVFFDQRCVDGSADLLDGLRAEVLRTTRGNRIFLAHLVTNALMHRPPLSLFGGISTVRHEEFKDAVDLKHSGIAPIVDLARVYALAVGHAAVNTYDRLSIAADGGEIPAQAARDLRDALQLIGGLRLQHQSRQLAQGLPADNFLSLSELSHFERTQLKDAFQVVAQLQSVLEQRFR